MPHLNQFHPVSNITELHPKCKRPDQQPSQWKEISGHPNYLISMYGDIWSLRHDCAIHGFVSKDDVRRRIISLDTKNYFQHILYASHWVDNPTNGKYPKPNNGDWLDFRPDNWYWSNVRGGTGYRPCDVIKLFNDVRDNITKTTPEKLMTKLEISSMILVRIQQAIIHMQNRNMTCDGETFISGFTEMKYLYEGKIYVSNTYQINPFGLLLYMDENRISFGTPGGNGYIHANLYEKGVPRRIVRLHTCVALSFIPNPNNKPQVNHINSIRCDPCVWNLEWVTNAENIEHARLHGHIAYGEQTNTSHLTEKDVEKICVLLGDNQYSNKRIAKMFNVSLSTIKSIRSGVSWLHISSRPEYDIRWFDFSSHKSTGIEIPEATRIVQDRLRDFRENGRNMTQSKRKSQPSPSTIIARGHKLV